MSKSSLSRHAAAMRDPDPAAARRAAYAAWHDHGLILINVEWLKTWTDQKQAELLAEKMYGKRKVKT